MNGESPANRVLNASAAREITLSRGGRSETYTVKEAAAEEAIPVPRASMAEIRVTRPYFDATSTSSDEALAGELAKHTAFRLTAGAVSRLATR